jgi:hypothetical protein
VDLVEGEICMRKGNKEQVACLKRGWWSRRLRVKTRRIKTRKKTPESFRTSKREVRNGSNETYNCAMSIIGPKTLVHRQKLEVQLHFEDNQQSPFAFSNHLTSMRSALAHKQSSGLNRYRPCPRYKYGGALSVRAIYVRYSAGKSIIPRIHRPWASS